MRSDFDVAVVGAGPAGAATARWLGQRGYRVALLEQSRLDAPRVGESLAPSTQPLLRALGVWEEFLALEPLPSYGTRSVWGGPLPEDHSHIVHAYGCGWHVDRLAFDRMLVASAAASGVDVRQETRLRSCSLEDGEWHVAADGPAGLSRLRARVLVDATGRSARVARSVGAEQQVFDQLVGVGMLTRARSSSPGGYVLVETSPYGWWYSAPVGPDGVMTMLMTDGDVCGRAKLGTLAAWRELLADAPHTAARTIGPVAWGPRVVSARSQRLRRRELTSPWLAVGDAALAVDPISGSGVVRALRTARAAAEAAMKIVNGDSESAIEAYESERDTECATYIRERAAYYGAEQRWRDFPFWSRRIASDRLLSRLTGHTV